MLREADAIVFCQDATASPDDVRTVMSEVARAGIERPGLLALTKVDEADPGASERFRGAFPGLDVVTTSVLDDVSLVRLKAAAWRLTRLIRVHVRDGTDPLALPSGSTVLDVARGDPL